MINFESLFNISYGLYIVTAGNKEKGNGFISNTVFQITSEPIIFATSCNKNNYTAEFIEKNKTFAVSVLNKNASKEIISKFGYRSGKNIDKLAGLDIKFGTSDTPIVLNETIAYYEFNVKDKIDFGTHWIFIGELIEADTINPDAEPLTYAFYREKHKGVAPKNAPTYIERSKLKKKEKPEEKAKIYECVVCGHIYDENIEKIKFADLPDDWECPDCGAEKSDFVEISK